jgi:hypothetical protein
MEHPHAQHVSSRPNLGPPAVWLAFVRQGAWKSWVLILQFFVIALLILANLRLSQRPPDVVVVAPDGKSTYVTASIAGEALVRFLAAQKQEPSDLTVLHFTRDFLELALAVNSSTIEAAWPKALAMMSPPLRARVARESAEQKLLETYKLARVRTQLVIEDVSIVEHVDSLLHVKATVSRLKSEILDGTGGSRDRLEVDIVERVVPRTIDTPDGLELVDFNVKSVESGSGIQGNENAAAQHKAGNAP